MTTSRPNQSIEPTGGSRFCRYTFVSRWRLPPVAHAHRSAAAWERSAILAVKQA